jgi:DNA-binding transcriptional MerR regulator
VPKPKLAINAFPPAKASEIVGLSVHMLNYLAREGYLVPSYIKSGRRGKTRYYSYRDLVIARIVQKLLSAGLEISRLKEGIEKLPKYIDRSGLEGATAPLGLLATDGRNVFFPNTDGTLLDLTQHGQLAFAFVMDASAAENDVKQNLTAEQRVNFDLKNRKIKYA